MKPLKTCMISLALSSGLLLSVKPTEAAIPVIDTAALAQWAQDAASQAQQLMTQIDQLTQMAENAAREVQNLTALADIQNLLGQLSQLQSEIAQWSTELMSDPLLGSLVNGGFDPQVLEQYYSNDNGSALSQLEQLVPNLTQSNRTAAEQNIATDQFYNAQFAEVENINEKIKELDQTLASLNSSLPTGNTSQLATLQHTAASNTANAAATREMINQLNILITQNAFEQKAKTDSYVQNLEEDILFKQQEIPQSAKTYGSSTVFDGTDI